MDEQLTRTPNGVHYSSKHTWTPNGIHLLLILRDLAPDVTSRDMKLLELNFAQFSSLPRWCWTLDT